jgi:hypothetical protein
MPMAVHLDATTEQSFWDVLDRAIAYRYGLVISGPPPSTVFLDVPRQTLLEAKSESMMWHRDHEKATLYSVVNACRAWRFAEENFLGSKLEATAAWARRDGGASSRAAIAGERRPESRLGGTCSASVTRRPRRDRKSIPPLGDTPQSGSRQHCLRVARLSGNRPCTFTPIVPPLAELSVTLLLPTEAREHLVLPGRCVPNCRRRPRR